MIFYRFYLILPAFFPLVLGNVTNSSLAAAEITLANPHLDSNGWIVFGPSADTHVFYVSSSMGNDSNNGLTQETPLATIAAGKARLRNGYPDRLLLKAGDTFADQAFGFLRVSGRSATAPMVIGTYGDGPAPVVEVPNVKDAVGIGSLARQGGNFLVVEGIDFYAYTRDPTNPAYAGPNTSQSGTAFLNPNTWVLLEGNKFRFFSTDVIFNSSNNDVTSSQVVLYRNVVTDAWSATSHSQGVYVSGVGNLVIEQNLFDHNGWNASIPGAEATIFNRNVYLQYNNGLVTFIGNISANSSSEGAQLRSGGIISGNLFVADSSGFSFGENPGTTIAANGQVVPVPTVTSTVAIGNVVLNSTDIRSSSGLLPRGQGIEVFNASGPKVKVTNNIIADPTGSRVNQSGISLNTNVTEIIVINNIISNVVRPIVDSGHGNTTAPNVISQNEHNASIGLYNASLGGNASLTEFMAEARKQSRNYWRTQYTADAVTNYIRSRLDSNSDSGRRTP